MTHDERWMADCQEVMGFMETNHWRPSRYRLEEHDMLNWLKTNSKKMNAGELKEERVVKFQKLLEAGERYWRVNQWQYDVVACYLPKRSVNS